MNGPVLANFLIKSFLRRSNDFSCSFITIVYYYSVDMSSANCKDCCEKDAQIAKLEHLVKKLEGTIAQNSTNSSKPPSSDGLQKKPTIPGSQRRSSGKKPGGQPGHKGTTLSQVKKPDKVVLHSATRCPCGHDLSDQKPDKVETSHVFDLPPAKIEVTEHQFETKLCPCCHKEVTAPLPAGLSGVPAEYGPGIKALATYLVNRHLLPCRRTAELLEELYGIRVSIGSITQWAQEAFEGLADFEQAAVDELANSDVVNFDETGMRCEGMLHWLHSASTEKITFFGIHPERGSKAMKDFGILPRFHGVAVHDHWKPYFGFGKCTHALCNSHILRELKFLDEIAGERWARKLHDLLIEINTQVTMAKTKNRDCLPRSMKRYFLQKYEKILGAGVRYHAEHDPVFVRGARGRAKQAKGKNLLDRLCCFQNEVLRFMNDFRVPFTNNQGEQDIRMNKVKQKISGCFRSFGGARYFCRIGGYLSTMRKQGNNLLNAVLSIYLRQPILIAKPP